ncbi:uncharacterized protein LAESUDRAFT_761203 [Laetiporus sulphureus 93-53]|uniref:Uncharacterized protein n=1 Tax=Laetiporus sulphureus 93-53 TaxID=1314785 RepID=A0A165D956_9APHY|nr:uncharacterized protein LAESUDRAFT_761203 [Laetiporus sulphureus 93-53]KZT04363.1 hypothetical protein LAESUDRAFT_761203 [Laetiporus sulphureus 93-53]
MAEDNKVLSLPPVNLEDEDEELAAPFRPESDSILLSPLGPNNVVSMATHSGSEPEMNIYINNGRLHTEAVRSSHFFELSTYNRWFCMLNGRRAAPRFDEPHG